jgi:hypothetical protein
MREKILTLGIPDSAERVVARIEEVLTEKCRNKE